MADELTSPLSSHDEASVSVRKKDLATEVMGEMDFGSAAFYVIRGRLPSAGETRVVNAMFSSLMVHGTTPHAIAARMTLLSEPTSIQGAVASGLLGVGSRYAGAMEECASVLQEVEANGDIDATKIVSRYRSAGEPFPGIGHRNFDPVDPRAERLFELAREADDQHLPGAHTELLYTIRTEFEDTLDVALPINVTGAIAALTSDMGFTPPGARGIAIVSRATGLVAEAIDEQASPNAQGMKDLIERNVEYTTRR